MITHVDFWPRFAAESFQFTSAHAVVSITDPGQALAKIDGTGALLRLAFLDVHGEESGVEDLVEKMFSEAQATELLSFLTRLQEEQTPLKLIVHCEAGISRSAAVSLVAEAFTGCTFSRRPQADLANRRVLQLCGDILGKVIEPPPRQKTREGIFLFTST